MSRQLQTWFFDGTPGPTSDVFLTGGFPTQDTFQNLVDSVPFFEDPDSSASLLQQGLVMMTTDTNALSRASAATGAMTTMIQPHQLPMMLSEILVPNNNPALAPVPASVLSEIGAGAYGTYKGILTRGVSQTVASITRLDYQLEFDPSSLPVVTVEPTNYDGVIFDYADSTAKRINRSIFNGGNILWEEEGGLFVCLSALPTQFKNFIQFDPAGAGAEIYPADNTGAGIPMYIRGGSAAGGTGNLGGNLYLYGGSGIQGGNPGNVSICYNGSGSSNTGWLGVGCAAANGYQLKVCGNVLITGTLTVQGTGGPGIAPGGGPALTMVLGVDNTGVMSTVTPGNMMNLLINTVPSTKGIVHYNGTAYALMPAPPTGLANQYVWYDASGNLGLTPLTYSVAITAANLASGFTLTSDDIKS